ncbi:MAG TPA: ComF family protein [Chitinophagaceae bacterium]|nr:ComF family protein [Chitinophagaceae bacterium]
MNTINLIKNGLVQLFFPHTCYGCGSDLLSKESLLCPYCLKDLPETNFAKYADNPVEKIFWGRIPVKAAMTGFYFSKHAIIQTLIHQLKYKGKKEVGAFLGNRLALQLKNSTRFAQIDALLPLPLFPHKLKLRGYNQAAVIADGMSEVLEIPVLNNVITRKIFTETQTRKGRTDRWQNVKESFALLNGDAIQNKHVLLVDDVITTGATTEACGSILLSANNVQLSIAALAFATD